MEKMMSFRISRPNQNQHSRKVSFRCDDNPLAGDFKNELIDKMGITLNEGETVRLHNATQKKAIIDSEPLYDQIQEDDDVYWATDGMAG